MRQKGFTVVEIIVMIVVLGILLTISITAYNSWRKNVSEDVLKSDMLSGASSLRSYQNFNNYYPPNLAGTKFAASPGIGLTIYTNAPYVGIFENLSDHENAQLLLNACNANLGSTNHTACVFAGNKNGAKIHVKGTVGSNSIWDSPIYESDIVLRGADPSMAQNIIAEFKAQGGVFPVIVRGNKNVTLPEPTKKPNGEATRYCLEGRSGDFDIVYHSTNEDDKLIAGPCPDDPQLHYFP